MSQSDDKTKSTGKKPDDKTKSGGDKKVDDKATAAWGDWASNLYDRAYGVVLASALGDVLESPQSGQWVDTALAVPILEAISRGEDLLSDVTQGRIVSKWLGFYATKPDGLGDTTRGVFDRLSKEKLPSKPSDDDYKSLAEKARSAAKEVRAGENVGEKGGLVRAGPVALAYLYTDSGGGKTADAARALSELTHDDDMTGDACALWATGIRHTLLTGQPNLASALALLPDSRRAEWEKRLQKTEGQSLYDTPPWSVQTLQAAYGAIWQGEELKDTLERGIKAGGDGTGAVCGAFAGSVFGGDEVKDEWRAKLKGWPEWTSKELEGVTKDILERQTEEKRLDK